MLVFKSKERKKEKEVLSLKLNIFPIALTLLTEAEVATVQLYDLKLMLHCRDLCRCQLTKVAAECYEASVSSALLSEDTTLEGFSSFTVDEATYLHFLTTCKGQK